jgi:hypothetical protein
MSIPPKLRESGLPPPKDVLGEGDIQTIDHVMVDHYGMQTFTPPGNQIGQGGTIYAVNSRLKRRGDWAKGGKL